MIPNSGLDRYIFNFRYFLLGSSGRGGWAAFEAGRVSLALFFLFRSYVLFCDVERRVFLLFCALTRATAPFCFATANRRHHPPPYITHSQSLLKLIFTLLRRFAWPALMGTTSESAKFTESKAVDRLNPTGWLHRLQDPTV